jgi:glycosyltransferase involved in cell wall biosynthesis
MVHKILFVSIFREGSGGGEGRIAYEMARWFSKDYQVMMLCPGTDTTLTTDGTGFKQFTVTSTGEGNTTIPLLSAVNVRKIYQFLDEFKPDVVHIHDPALLGVVAQLWAKLHQVPVFYTAHIIPSRALDFGTGEVANFLNAPINEALVERYLLNFYANCDAVIGLNDITSAEIREFGYTGPLIKIPNGRNLSPYQACQLADNQAAVKTLIFIGFLSKRKNQVYLLDVMQHLPTNYHLLLVGAPLVPAYQDELQQIVTAKHLNVTFTGQLDYAVISALLEKSHVFVSASRMEVQSLVVIEALASGTPVVGLANETVDELVDDTNGAHLPKDASPEMFASAVRKVCESPAVTYRERCEHARARVKNLDWSNVMRETVQSYEKIIAGQSEKPVKVNASDFLARYVAQIPAGRLHDDIVTITTNLTLPMTPSPRVPARALWITSLNIVVSIVGFYIVKGPVYLVQKLSRKIGQLNRQERKGT